MKLYELVFSDGPGKAPHYVYAIKPDMESALKAGMALPYSSLDYESHGLLVVRKLATIAFVGDLVLEANGGARIVIGE